MRKYNKKIIEQLAETAVRNSFSEIFKSEMESLGDAIHAACCKLGDHEKLIELIPVELRNNLNSCSRYGNLSNGLLLLVLHEKAAVALDVNQFVRSIDFKSRLVFISNRTLWNAAASLSPLFKSINKLIGNINQFHDDVIVSLSSYKTYQAAVKGLPWIAEIYPEHLSPTKCNIIPITTINKVNEFIAMTAKDITHKAKTAVSSGKPE